VLPAFGAWRFDAPLVEVSDSDVDNFLTTELAACCTSARADALLEGERAEGKRAARGVHVQRHDGHGNAYADILRARDRGADPRLARRERDAGERRRPGGARVVEPDRPLVQSGGGGLPFAAGQAARLLFLKRRIPQISLYVPQSIVEATGSQRSVLGWIESLLGLHLGKCVLITGGSAGIGGQLARLLAIAGARVMMTARRASELDAHRRSIVKELEDIGYYQPHERVHVLADIDVGDEGALKKALDAAMKAFGRIDYLINNAGVAGAEQMAVDMDPTPGARR
jgi:malonyl-CoA reductase / 3-hydroxypropionate dehydrogenase (NADP+)